MAARQVSSPTGFGLASIIAALAVGGTVHGYAPSALRWNIAGNDASRRGNSRLFAEQVTLSSSEDAAPTDAFTDLLPSSASTTAIERRAGRSIRRHTGLSSSLLPAEDNTPTDAFADLLPSSASAVTIERRSAGVGRSTRRHTGLSSSALLPSTANLPQPSPPTNEQWKSRLLDVSNLASMLCVLDCTLLPLVSVAFPAISWIIGITAASSATAAVPQLATFTTTVLPALGHAIALCFVLPVGVLTTAVNYFFGHKQVRFVLPAVLGLACIYAANSSTGVGVPVIDGALEAWGIATHSHAHAGVAHVEGWAHRLTNTAGCALLLGTNYASKKYVEVRGEGGNCAAGAFAEAFGGGGDATSMGLACGPGCNCGVGPTSGNIGGGNDAFFQWEAQSGGEGKRTMGDNIARKGGFAGPFSRLRR